MIARVTSPDPTRALFAHQELGVHWLLQDNVRGYSRRLLADDMGTGKTLQAIIAADLAKGKKILVLSTVTGLGHWEKEILSCFPNDSVSVPYGSAEYRTSEILKKPRWLLLSHESMAHYEVALRRYDADIVIVDEAHHFRHRHTKKRKALFRVTHPEQHLYLLTGTPIYNYADDLWSLLNLLDRKSFSSYWHFIDEHFERQKQWIGKRYVSVPGQPNYEKLRETIKPWMLRRERSEMLDIVTFTRMEELEMLPKQEKIYRELEKDYHVRLSTGELLTTEMALTRVLRLRQLSTMPAVLEPSIDPGESSKLAYAIQLVKDMSPTKFVIFTTWVESALYLHEQIAGSVCVTGAMEYSMRLHWANYFQETPECPAFIGTIKSCSEVLTLTAASVAVFVDHEWSAQANKQALDRLRRIGQDRPVTALVLYNGNTVDERVLQLVEQKHTIFDQTIRTDLTSLVTLLTPAQKTQETL